MKVLEDYSVALEQHEGTDVFVDTILSFHQEGGQLELQKLIGHLAETFNSFASFQPGKKTTTSHFS